MIIKQTQSQSLLKEHAHSSFNYTFLGRNELFLASGFLLIGIIISLFKEQTRLAGIPFIVIGLLEIYKYPGREKRWVKKKEKEGIFNKDFKFEVLNDSLTISYDEKSKSHKFHDMRKCLVSQTGVLFKVSYSEYYYISFKSIVDKKEKETLLDILRKGFPTDGIRIK